eukprot:3384619-Rhodomonas_salina.1
MGVLPRYADRPMSGCGREWGLTWSSSRWFTCGPQVQHTAAARQYRSHQELDLWYFDFRRCDPHL